jgi:thiamine biosynthesis protein ThiS
MRHLSGCVPVQQQGAVCLAAGDRGGADSCARAVGDIDDDDFGRVSAADARNRGAARDAEDVAAERGDRACESGWRAGRVHARFDIIEAMQIVVNGESRAVGDQLTLTQLLAEFELTPNRVAIEVNEQLVRRAQYGETPLREGDRVEIVTLVGGG